MNDETTPLPEDDELPESEEPSDKSHEELMRVLQDLTEATSSLHTAATTLLSLANRDYFSRLSKAARSSLLGNMLEHVATVEELTKISHRKLKRVRRQNPSPELTDALLIADAS